MDAARCLSQVDEVAPDGVVGGVVGHSTRRGQTLGLAELHRPQSADGASFADSSLKTQPPQH